MSRIKINHACNVCTGDDSHAYRSAGHQPRPEITVPQFRVRLSAAEARALAGHLMEAVEFIEGMEKESPMEAAQRMAREEETILQQIMTERGISRIEACQVLEARIKEQTK